MVKHNINWEIIQEKANHIIRTRTLHIKCKEFMETCKENVNL